MGVGGGGVIGCNHPQRAFSNIERKMALPSIRNMVPSHRLIISISHGRTVL